MPPSSLIWGSPIFRSGGLDKACADMVINAPIIGGNKLAETHPHEHLEGEDKFHLIHPDTNWQAGLRYAEEIGLGSQAYELITV